MRRLGAFETAQMLTSEAFSMNVVVALRLDPLPHAEELQSSLQRVCSRHPLLGVRVERRKQSYWFVADAAPPTVLSIGRMGGRHWQDVVEQQLSLGFNNEAGPLVRCVHLSDPSSQKGELVFTFHHSIVDAISISYLLHQILGPDDETPAEPADPLHLPAPADRRFPSEGRGWRLAKAIVQVSFRQIIEEFQWRRTTPPIERPKVHKRGSPRTICLQLDTGTTERLVRACRNQRVTLYSALSSSLMLAVRRTLYSGEEARLFRHFQFANLRSKLEPRARDEEVGSHFAMVRLAYSVSPTSQLWDLARDVSDKVRDTGKSGERYASAITSRHIMKALLTWRRARMGETALSYTPPGLIPDAYGGTRVVEAHVFASNMVLGPVYTAQARIFLGRLWWDIVYLDSDMDEEVASKVAQEIREILVAAAE